MSYCVNCGVELAESEQCCPLCHTRVVNPNNPWKAPEKSSYPTLTETINHTIDKQFMAKLATLILLLPLFITLFCNLITSGQITWSAYVAGALTMIFILVVFPFFFKRFHAVPMLLLDCAAVLLYLLLIEQMTGGAWFLPIALPIVLISGACLVPSALIFTHKGGTAFLTKIAGLLFASGLIPVGVEAVLSVAYEHALSFRWSIYVLIPCAILAVIALLLKKQIKLREQIRKKLFF